MDENHQNSLPHLNTPIPSAGDQFESSLQRQLRELAEEEDQQTRSLHSPLATLERTQALEKTPLNLQPVKAASAMPGWTVPAIAITGMTIAGSLIGLNMMLSHDPIADAQKAAAEAAAQSQKTNAVVAMEALKRSKSDLCVGWCSGRTGDKPSFWDRLFNQQPQVASYEPSATTDPNPPPLYYEQPVPSPATAPTPAPTPEPAPAASPQYPLATVDVTSAGAEALNLRDAPNGNSLAAIPQGQQLEMIQQTGDWVYVRWPANGMEGWVFKQGLQSQAVIPQSANRSTELASQWENYWSIRYQQDPLLFNKPALAPMNGCQLAKTTYNTVAQKHGYAPTAFN